MAVDIIGRELAVGDHVAFYGNVYSLLFVPPTIPGYNPHSSVKMILLNKSKTTKPVVKQAREVALLPKEDILMWLLKKDAK